MSETTGYDFEAARAARVLVIVLMGLAGCAGLRAADAEHMGSSVSGTVKDADTLEPISRAVVTLRSSDDAHVMTAITDSSGSYEISDILPGRYYLLASRNLFITQLYGAHRTAGEGAPLSIAEQTRLDDLDIQLRRQGVITGRVLTEDQEPVPRASVQLIQNSLREGNRRLRPVQGVTTNDLGEYRFYGVRPGEYYVSAYHGGGGLLGLSAATTFYPSSLGHDSAIALGVAAGQSVEAIDITLITAKVVNVRARVSGLPAPEFASISLRSRLAVMSPTKRADQQIEPGLFEFRDVRPGSYLLIGEALNGGRAYRAIVPLDVLGRDLGTVHVPFSLEQQIAGELLPSSSPPPDLGDTSIHFKPVSEYVRSISAPVSREGRFVAGGLVSEQCYFVRLVSGSEGLFMVYFGLENGQDRDAAEPFCVPNTENIAPLIVSVSTSGGVLSGLVEDSGQGPVPGARVLLKHQNSERSWQSVQTRITDYTGRYENAGLAPGKYRALALLETDEEQVDATRQLRELDHGTVVEVPPYSNISLSLPLSAN